MFNSFQFKENLIYFQQLLGEGVFNISLLGAKPEEWKTLERLALSNLSKSKWVEHYNFLKVCTGLFLSKYVCVCERQREQERDPILLIVLMQKHVQLTFKSIEHNGES